MSAPLHACPGGCGRQVVRALFACSSCWRRLPRSIRVAITDGWGARHHIGMGAWSAAVRDARDWYRANGVRS